MCDYSLTNVKSRPAIVGERLVTHDFNTGTIGFAAESDLSCAVCIKPGTEIGFDATIKRRMLNDGGYATAIFRQVNKDTRLIHHDALELPNGEIFMLASMATGQWATILQLPAEPRNEREVEEQKRLEYSGA